LVSSPEMGNRIATVLFYVSKLNLGIRYTWYTHIIPLSNVLKNQYYIVIYYLFTAIGCRTRWRHCVSPVKATFEAQEIRRYILNYFIFFP